MKSLSIFLLILISINTVLLAQKKPKIIESIDDFEGFTIIKSEKKVFGFVQLSVRAIISDNDTIYKVNTNLLNQGGILDKNKPYFVILSNDNKHKLTILHTTLPGYNNNSYITNYTFQIPNNLVNEFMESSIVKSRVYYITDTYEEISGGVVSTALTTYLTAVYNRVNNID